MIPGCVDSQNVQDDEFDDQLEPPFWLPEGALVHLDWVNQNFWWGSEERVQTDGLGGSYDPTDASDLGLLMRLSPNMNGISLLSELLAIFVQLLHAGCTIVVDADAESGGSLTFVEGMFFWYMDNVDPNSVFNIVTYEPSTSPRSFNASTVSGDGFFQYNETMNNFGINSFAFTMNAPISGPLYRWGGSINGKTAAFEDNADRVSDTQVTFPRVDLFAIQEFDFGLEDCYVRRLTIYPPATVAAELEALAQPYFLPQDVTATFANVSLLCHFNGTDGDTTTTDSSSLAHTVSLSDGAALDDGIVPRLGSTALMFPGTGNPSMSVANHASLLFGSGPFVIEFSAQFDNNTSASPFVIGHTAANQFQWAANFGSSGSGVQFSFSWSFDGVNQFTWDMGTLLGEFLAVDTWHDIKIERDSQDVVRIHVNAELKMTRIIAGALHASTAALVASWFTGTSGTIASVDEMRVTKGDWWYGPNGVDAMVAEFPNS